MNANYEIQLDSSSSIKITADGGDDHKITTLVDSSEARASDSSLVNNAFRRTASTGDNQTVNSNIIWRKKFKKKGRTLSFNLKENYTDNNSTGYLYSQNNYYLKNILASDTLTDQYKVNHSESVSFNTKLTYTEPLSKVSSLVLNYGVNVNNSTASVNSYNKGLDGKYSVLDTLFSNDYRFNIFTNRGGIAYSLFKKKFKMTVGSDAGFSTFDQTNNRTDSTLTRNFVNWYPQTNASYEFTQQRRIFFNYRGSTQQPTINQIQPVLTNTDPLNITIGNALLKPAFENNLQLGFFDYKVLKDRQVFINANYQFTDNAIVNKSYVDSFGRTVNQYINMNGNRSLQAYLDYGFKVKKPDFRIDFNSNINLSRNVGVVNNLFNVTNSGNYTFGLYFNKEKEKKFSANIGASATYSTSFFKNFFPIQAFHRITFVL